MEPDGAIQNAHDLLLVRLDQQMLLCVMVSNDVKQRLLGSGLGGGGGARAGGGAGGGGAGYCTVRFLEQTFCKQLYQRSIRGVFVLYSNPRQ